MEIIPANQVDPVGAPIGIRTFEQLIREVPSDDLDATFRWCARKRLMPLEEYLCEFLFKREHKAAVFDGFLDAVKNQGYGF